MAVQSDMEECIGATELIEYIEQSADGTIHNLMGWPPQTDDPSIQSSQFLRATLESWYPNTSPTVPTSLKWIPYKVAKTTPHLTQPAQGHPLHAVLRYHKDVGWHYRYSLPCKVHGRPPLPSSRLSGIP